MTTALIKQEIRLPEMFSVTAEAEAERNKLAERSQEIVAVTTAPEQNSAVEASRNLRSYVKDVETTRKALTEPLLHAQRLLKSLTDDHIAPLLVQQTRIEYLVTGFQISERRRVEEEEKKRREEIERLEDERQAAERKARDEIAQLYEAKAEAAQWASQEAAKAKNAKQRAAFAEGEKRRLAEEEIRMLIASQALAEAEHAKAASTAAIMAPLPEAQKARGVATKRELRVEVTDIHALYRSRPDLVRLEANIAGIKATCVPEMPNLPDGLKLWWEMKTSTRAW